MYLPASSVASAPVQRFCRVLSIAGSDSGGGAGIQADLKTFCALGVFGMTAITAITAQNTQGIWAIHPVPVDMVAAQIDAVASDIGADAVKIGMLYSAETMQAVAAALRRHGLAHVVLDPVAVSTSGTRLMPASAMRTLVQSLFGLADVITPNLDEAAVLLGRCLCNEADMRQAAADLQRMGARAVLMKGGHLPADTDTGVVDVLRLADGTEHIWRDTRIASANTHGTGCTLSSALAAYLALGYSLPDATEHARLYVRQAIAAAVPIRMGRAGGRGALGHGFAPVPMRLTGSTAVEDFSGA